MEYAYRRVGTKNFEETLEDVEASVERFGFAVVQRYDITAALAAKGFPIRPLAIFEIAPQRESENPVSLLLPCRINVYQEADSEMIVAALRPTLWSAVFPEHELDEIAEEIERTVMGIVDSAVE